MFKLTDTDNILPSHVMVGGSKYSLVPKDRDWYTESGLHGSVTFDDMTIRVCTEQEPSEVLNTLLHELSHVIWREWSLPKRPREERCVTAMGYGWTALYTQNPELLEAIDALAGTNKPTAHANRYVCQGKQAE